MTRLYADDDNGLIEIQNAEMLTIFEMISYNGSEDGVEIMKKVSLNAAAMS